MKYLLDTCVFLWLIFNETDKVPAKTLSLIRDNKNDVFLSTASCWEIAIKTKIGKIELEKDPADLIPEIASQMNLKILPVEMKHALGIYKLPFHHKDPFDRLLVSQAFHEKLALLTPDQFLEKYEITVTW